VKTKLIVIGLVALLGATVVGAAAAHRFITHKGTRGADVLNGSDAVERFFARGGNDVVNALGGNDRIWAGWGNDTVDAGNDNDRVWGGPGNDTLNGGGGNDLIRGRHGNDLVDGGEGNDRLWVGRGADTENGGPGDDRLHALANDDMTDTINCGEGRDIVWLNSAETDVVNADCEIRKTVTVTSTDAD
jgi:Ca2+-binding RTX toxin-like protein